MGISVTTLIVTVAGPPALAARSPSGAAAVHRQTRTEADDATGYWTAGRMAAATPLGDGDGADPAGPVRTGDMSPGGDSGRARIGWAWHFRGVPSVGALFFSSGRGDHYCTASVVQSPHADLVLTAAHCLYGGRHHYVSRVVFVPRYAAGRRPYGVWPIRSIMVDRRWARHLDPDLDFAFATIRPRHGRWIGRMIRGNRLGTDAGFRNWVHVIGYPNLRTNRRDVAVGCASRTSRAGRFQMRFRCGGFTGGTSGSPWLAHYDARTGTGEVIGVIGGLHKGGWTAIVSYSSYFDHDIRRLYTQATAGPADR